MSYDLSRLPAVKARHKISRTTVYEHVADGIFPPPIRIGPRAVAWLDAECDAVLAARVAGKSDDEIRSLIAALVAARNPANAA